MADPDPDGWGAFLRSTITGGEEHDGPPFTHTWAGADPVETGDGEWTEAPQGPPLTVSCSRGNGKSSGVLTPEFIKTALDDLWHQRAVPLLDDFAIEAATWAASDRHRNA